MKITYIKNGVTHVERCVPGKSYRGAKVLSIELTAEDAVPETVESLQSVYLPRMVKDAAKVSRPISKTLTGDGEEFQAGELYLYYDSVHGQVYAGRWEEIHVRRQEGIVYHEGYQIPIKLLRRARSRAIEDGKTFHLKRIEEQKSIIARLEAEKSAAAQ